MTRRCPGTEAQGLKGERVLTTAKEKVATGSGASGTGAAEAVEAYATSPVPDDSTHTSDGADAPGHEVVTQRILVAEDNETTQELLKFLLLQRGHEVDIVADGAAALEALNTQQYDVVLMDFHLPKMDGLKVTSAFRSDRPQQDQPRFVAITADMEGLLGNDGDCETFDGVLPKPFDLERVCKVVEGEVQEVYVAKSGPAKLSPDMVHSGRSEMRPPAPDIDNSPVQSLGYEFLRWPDDFDADRLSARFLQAMLDDSGRFDAIVVREPASLDDLTAIWSTKGLQVLPIIDLTGRLGPAADLDGASLSFGETAKVDALIADFHQRRARLHHDVLYDDDLATKLLGRAYVSAASLTPAYHPAAPGLIAYNAALDGAQVEQEAENLRAQGYLERTFFDRLHVCGACGSSRFNVREECGKCGSPHLSEQAYLHHFTCAYQGPEADFRQGDELICPKCRKELAHYSVDYDKPGSVLVCEACTHPGSEPAVGFLCLDCGAHANGDTVGTKDVYGYSLTDKAIGYVETGRALLGRDQHALRLSALPLEVIVAVNSELQAYKSDGVPFSLLDICYRNEREIAREHGARQFTQARDLFLENLKSVLRKEDKVIAGVSYDFAVLDDVRPEQALDALDYLHKEANQGIKLDLGVAFNVFGPEDFA